MLPKKHSSTQHAHPEFLLNVHSSMDKAAFNFEGMWISHTPLSVEENTKKEEKLNKKKARQDHNQR